MCCPYTSAQNSKAEPVIGLKPSPPPLTFSIFLPHTMSSVVCYPSLPSTAPHKLSRSALGVHLGFSAHHKGYRCLDLWSNQTIVSRHVILDESTFPFATQPSPPTTEDLAFLDDLANLVPLPLDIAPHLPYAGSPSDPIPHYHVR